MFILHAACGVWVKNIYWQAHLKIRRTDVPIVKPTRCTGFTNLFILSNTLHFSDGLSVHHQELKTVHTATIICQTGITEIDKCTVFNF